MLYYVMLLQCDICRKHVNITWKTNETIFSVCRQICLADLSRFIYVHVCVGECVCMRVLPFCVNIFFPIVAIPDSLWMFACVISLRNGICSHKFPKIWQPKSHKWNRWFPVDGIRPPFLFFTFIFKDKNFWHLIWFSNIS